MTSHRRPIECPVYHQLIPKTKTKSPVWAHFGLPVDEKGHIVNDNITVCKLCLTSVSSKGGSTSNMSAHLKLYHPLVFPDLPTKQYSITSSCESTCKDADDPSNSITNVLKHYESFEEKDEANARKKRKKIFLDIHPFDASSAESCTLAVTKFLGTTMQPYNLVEMQAFIDMVKTLNAQYILPDHKYFTKTGIPKLYNDTAEKVRQELSEISDSEISVTTDCWTSVSNTPFIAVSVHYITHEWVLRSACLSCKNLEEDHNVDNICDILSTTLSDWGIQIKNVVSCTTDNCDNISEAARQLELTHISCFGHTINIGVNNALELLQLKTAVARLKKLQITISHSWKMKRDLKKAQEMLGLEVVALPSICPTRWRSTLKLCKRFLSNQIAICKMLLDYPSKKHLMPEGCEVLHIENFVTATRLLEDMMQTLCIEEYTIASSVLPLYRQIKRNLQPEESESVVLQSIKKEILIALTEKYEKEPLMSILQIASLCDPRFHLRFTESAEQVRHNAIQKMADIYTKIYHETNFVVYNQETSVPKAKKGLAKFLELEDEDESTGNESKPISHRKAETELKNYLMMPRISADQNPLLWWKSHEKTFPLLKVLARQFLSIQGTSVLSERIFGTRSSVITKHRASLLPKNAEMQVFLAQNINFI